MGIYAVIGNGICGIVGGGGLGGGIRIGVVSVLLVWQLFEGFDADGTEWDRITPLGGLLSTLWYYIYRKMSVFLS